MFTTQVLSTGTEDVHTAGVSWLWSAVGKSKVNPFSKEQHGTSFERSRLTTLCQDFTTSVSAPKITEPLSVSQEKSVPGSSLSLQTGSSFEFYRAISVDMEVFFVTFTEEIGKQVVVPCQSGASGKLAMFLWSF